MSSTPLADQPRPTTSLPSSYVPADVEGPLYERWVDRGYFTVDPASGKPPYCIVIPPPNVTGSLHLGHAFEHTLMDALTRRRRMQGYEALWLPGMDHAGIATQTLVERQLAETEGRSRHDYSREEFVAKVWEWKAEFGGKILGQMRRLGDGVDWTRERFTMDEGLSRAVQTIFKRLYDDGLIYRAERIINWCPRCLTALSDIEVDHHDDDGELVSIRYGEGDAAIVVATTRAETMLGDTAVAVHPDDERYAHLVGTEVALPLTGRRIPIVADEHVDPAFGTGAVKVTPAHDPNDFEIGRRHDLPALTVSTSAASSPRPARSGSRPVRGAPRGRGRAARGGPDRLREAPVRARGRSLRPLRHGGRAAPVGAVVRQGRAAGEGGRRRRPRRARHHPPGDHGSAVLRLGRQHARLVHLAAALVGSPDPGLVRARRRDACLGPEEDAPQGWRQDQDVLDTWFSSALWPFSTLGWPDDTPDLRRFYPTDVLLTGYDIIFFWVARMMMFGLYAMDGVPPFKVVALTGLVRDGQGRKMSKSKGNVVDPLDWMDAYGSDALRFTLAARRNPGADVPISEEWVQGSRNFATKLWNASRFALMNGATVEGDLPGPPTSPSSTAGSWPGSPR